METYIIIKNSLGMLSLPNASLLDTPPYQVLSRAMKLKFM